MEPAPHARGSSSRSRTPGEEADVGPARAGIFPPARSGRTRPNGRLRTRGDLPGYQLVTGAVGLSTPHGRGSPQRGHTVKGQWRSQNHRGETDRQRPDAANARTELGHLESDLIVGAKNSQIATLVDRKSRYLTMVALPSRHTTAVIPALQQAFARMDARLLSTLTRDRGMDLAGHRLLTEVTGVDVFFATPHSPWQRGTNENTNKLIRQYLPKGIDLSLYSQADLDVLAARLNNRPRKCLGYRTPAQCVALTL